VRGTNMKSTSNLHGAGGQAAMRSIFDQEKENAANKTFYNSKHEGIMKSSGNLLGSQPNLLTKSASTREFN
jgi:hypothetical protein